MADDFDVATRDGDKTLRAVEVASGIFAPVQKVAPQMPTVVDGEQLNQTVGNTVFTMTVPSGATHALVSVEDDAVRMREDAADPSSTSGLLLPEGFIGELALPNALRFIRVTTDAKVNILYRKYA